MLENEAKAFGRLRKIDEQTAQALPVHTLLYYNNYVSYTYFFQCVPKNVMVYPTDAERLAKRTHSQDRRKSSTPSLSSLRSIRLAQPPYPPALAVLARSFVSARGPTVASSPQPDLVRAHK